MSADGRTATDEPAADGEDEPDPEEVTARTELLAAENERLRAEYTRVRKAKHRRTALGLVAVGAVALVGAAAFPDARTVLIALGATGVFGGLLTYYVTPERFVAASVGESVYRTTAANGEAAIDELGLSDERVYVPLGNVTPGRDVALYVPQHGEYDLPDAEALDALFVATDDQRGRGISLHPTGDPLLREFERTLAGPLADDPRALAAQLADGLVEAFELADGATPDVSPGDERASVGVRGSAFGPVDRFDHPVASFVACGLAAGLDEPVRLEAVTPGDDRVDYVVTCSWSGEK